MQDKWKKYSWKKFNGFIVLSNCYEFTFDFSFPTYMIPLFSHFADLVLSNKLVVYDLENMVIGWTDYNCEYESIFFKSKLDIAQCLQMHFQC